MISVMRLRQRFVEKIHALPWFKAGPRDSQPLIIHNRRIYVLPTGFGMFVGTVLAVLNLGSLNYNNNAALLLGFVLISLCNNALISGHLSLLKLAVSAQIPEPVFAGQSLQLPVTVQTRQSSAQSFQLAYHEHSVDFSLDSETTRAVLAILAPQRGLFPLDRIRLSTKQPLGLARAWAYLNLQSSALVYPSPSGRDLPADMHGDSGHMGRNARQKSEQPHHLREYRSGDARKHIAWKASARTDTLQVREYATVQSDVVALDWATLQALGYEQRISQLCLWVLQAEQKQRRYALKLPHLHVEAGSGQAHQRQCLQALALMPHDA